MGTSERRRDDGWQCYCGCWNATMGRQCERCGWTAAPSPAVTIHTPAGDALPFVADGDDALLAAEATLRAAARVRADIAAGLRDAGCTDPPTVERLTAAIVARLVG